MMWSSLAKSEGHRPGGRWRWTGEPMRPADRGNEPKGVSICSWSASALVSGVERSVEFGSPRQSSPTPEDGRFTKNP
ncbi:hypothetical protein M433DRAFT_151887 [Acidomyces richmondensis BFW]|nr:MAG: hypothetical protein FE78DRAFT_86428 [Acidomyces sp. 'richmondensis']KYG47735.1 hypothetical protein M433DRAFT_151887 [Acidomyces richmondensis BFW]